MTYQSLSYLDSLIAACESGWPVSHKSLLTLRALVALEVKLPPAPVPIPAIEELDE